MYDYADGTIALVRVEICFIFIDIYVHQHEFRFTFCSLRSRDHRGLLHLDVGCTPEGHAMKIFRVTVHNVRAAVMPLQRALGIFE